jgi:hypothetical protein
MAKKFSKDKNIDVVVSHGDQIIDTSTLTNKQWKSGMAVSIQGFGTIIAIINCPVVLSLSCFPMRHMRVGSPVVPTAE